MIYKSVVHRKRIVIHVFTQLLLIGLIIFVFNVPSVEAQMTNQWQPDKKVPGYSDDTHFTPLFVVDQNRTVHAFAVQPVGDEDRNLAIVYNQWNREKGWTIPIDILLFPPGDARIIGVFLDYKGIVHLAFIAGKAGDAKIYYSSAQITRAGDASAWSFPLDIGGGAINPCYGVIAGDNKDNLVILYNGNMYGNGIYTITSNDAGYSWSEPMPVYLTYADQLVPFTVNGYMSKSGKLHVVWNILNSAYEFVSLYYDRLDVESNQWDKPILLEKKPVITGFFGPAVPYIVDNDKYVVVMYNGGNPYAGQPVPFGRPTLLIQTSTNNGESWSGAINPFPLLTGSSGAHSLVIDSNQNIHALALMRIDSSVDGEYRAIGGMWHSELRNNIWSDPERYITSVKSLDLRAVVSQGNVLLAAWIEESVPGNGVWYSYTVLDSPELPVIPLATPSVEHSSTPTSLVPSPVVTPTHENKPLLIDRDITATYTPAQPLVFGLIPVVLLILGIIIMVQLRYRNKS